MKRKYNFFVSCDNGVSFGFDCAVRSSRKFNILHFDRIVSDSVEVVCQLDLNVSKLVFSFKCDNTIYFTMVSVGGASDGKQ